MSDALESLRRTLLEAGVPQDKLESILRAGGQVWTTDEAKAEFEFVGFAAPYVVVRRKSDKVKGTLTFTHHPRYYFDFCEVTS